MHVYVYVLSWGDERRGKKKVDDCSYTVLLCVKRERGLYTSSTAVSIPFFLSSLFSFCFLIYSTRFSFICSATHSTVRKSKSKEKKTRNNGGGVGQVCIITSSSSLLFFYKLSIGQKIFSYIYVYDLFSSTKKLFEIMYKSISVYVLMSIDMCLPSSKVYWPLRFILYDRLIIYTCFFLIL